MMAARNFANFRAAVLMMLAVTPAVGQHTVDRAAHRAARITRDALQLHYPESR